MNATLAAADGMYIKFHRFLCRVGKEDIFWMVMLFCSHNIVKFPT
jgi:hypothetical protein